MSPYKPEESNSTSSRHLLTMLLSAGLLLVGCAEPSVQNAQEPSNTLVTGENVDSGTHSSDPTTSDQSADSSSSSPDQKAQALASYFESIEGEWVLVRGETKELDPSGRTVYQMRMRSYGEAFFRDQRGWSYNGEACSQDQEGSEFCQDHQAGWLIRNQDLYMVVPGESPTQVEVVQASPKGIEVRSSIDGFTQHRTEKILENGHRFETAVSTYEDGSKTVTRVETRKAE